MESTSDFVESLILERYRALQRMERLLDQKSISREDYVSCRRAIVAGLDQLQGILLLLLRVHERVEKEDQFLAPDIYRWKQFPAPNRKTSR